MRGPLEEVDRCRELLAAHEKAGRELAAQRDDAIRAASKAGAPLRTIAHHAGLSFQRVAQIVASAETP